MISGDLRFEGFDSVSWTRLVSLFAPSFTDRTEALPQASDAPEFATTPAERDARGTLVVVVDDENNVLKATHTLRGRITGIPHVFREELPQLGRLYGADRVVWLRTGALEEMAERLALRTRRGDDYVSQWLVVMRVVRELSELGQLDFWPSPLANVPVPSPPMVRRALDVVLPDDHTAVVVLWDRGEPWTSIAIQRRGGAIDWVAGPDLIQRWTGPLGGDWRRDHRVVADAVARRMSPVHVGIFSEVDTIRRLLRDPNPGAWAVASAVRDVAFDPAPPYVAVALGADVLRGAAHQAATWLGAFGLLQSFEPLANSLRARVSDAASVTATLGFNPLSAIAAVLRGEDAAESRGETVPPGDLPPKI